MAVGMGRDRNVWVVNVGGLMLSRYISGKQARNLGRGSMPEIDYRP